MLRRWLLGVVALALLAAGAPAGAAPLPTTVPECADVDLLLDGDADPVATGTCPGVRPGAYVVTEQLGGGRAGCTFNFLFEGFARDDESQPLGQYIGTAGHCVGVSDEQSWADGDGPRAFDADDRHIGHYVFAVNRDDRDFAVIKLLPGVEAEPAMCHWGGPTGMFEELTSDPVELKHYGQGVGLGDTVPARTAWAERLGSPDTARAYGAAIFGDSGSGIISADGRALGVVVTIGFGTGAGSGTVGITRLPPQLQLAEDALNVDFELVTAPRL